MIEIAPRYTYKSFLFKAICLNKIGCQEEAFETLADGDRFFPNSKELLRLRGKLEVQLDLLAGARKTFKKLSLLEPDEPTIALANCNVLFASKKHEKCLRFAEISKRKFSQIENECTLIILNCLIALEKFERALEVLAAVT